MDVNKWDFRFLQLAHFYSRWSKFDEKQCGAVIIEDVNFKRQQISYGYNGPPRGLDDNKEHRHLPETTKYFHEHAERNAIYNANGDLSNCTLYATHYPCPNCARAIIQKGIKRVVIDAANGYDVDVQTHGKDYRAYCKEMFDETGTVILEITTKENGE